MNSQSRLLRRLGNRDIWGKSLAIFAFFFLAMLSFFTDVLLTEKFDWRWIAISAATYFEVFAIIWLAKVLFLNRLLAWRSGVIANILIAAIAGAIKNVSVGLVAEAIGLPYVGSLAFRAYGGVAMGLGLLFFFALILGSRLEHQSAMRTLTDARAALLAHRASAEQLFADAQRRLIESTQQSLLPKLARITELISARGDHLDALEQLRHLVSSDVRPLSESIRRDAQVLAAKPAAASDASTAPKYFAEKVLVKKIFKPGVTGLLFVLVQWSLIYIFVGEKFAWFGIPLAIVNALGIAGMQALIPESRKMNRGRVIYFALLVGIIASMPANLLGAFALFDANISNWLISNSLLMLITIWGFASSAILDSDRTLAEVETQKDVDSLKREVALFDQRVWLARRNWGLVIHGTVQSALTAAITRLSTEEKLEGHQFELVSQDLARATEALSHPPAIAVDFEQAQQDLIKTWSGICEVTWRVSERASRALPRDAELRMCVNEIAKEAVSNAVRHGNARWVKIDIDRTMDELLLIQVTNDGTAPRSKTSKGVGSAMYDELTLSWSLGFNKVRGITELTAALPFSAQQA